MEKKLKKWEVKSQEKVTSLEVLLKILLKNRGLTGKKAQDEFVSPSHPESISAKSLGIKKTEVEKIRKRIKDAKRKKETVIIYGDYDTDGICATAILWEGLYAMGVDVLPYIPERFSEGYGLNFASVEKLKEVNPNLGLVITVDNGIVAGKEIERIKKLGIDVIVCDHHQKGKTLPKADGLFYSDGVCGSALAWVLKKEITHDNSGLELVGIGTIADQMPLLGLSRSFTKFGLEELKKTKRPGLLALFSQAAILQEKIGTYEVGYLIAPRLNAMGRLAHGLDSLRLICTRNVTRASNLAAHLGETNLKRQKIMEEVMVHARKEVNEGSRVIILAHESYHEGVIGLAAGRLVEEFYRPAIVIAKGKKVSKGSARSISGFNIIEAIRAHEKYLLEGGGHPMAAGFSLETKKIEEFSLVFSGNMEKVLTDEILSPKLRIDLELDFDLINDELIKVLAIFNPTGMGNPNPTFLTKEVEVIEAKLVGSEGKHLKLVLAKKKHYFDAIGFGLGYLGSSLKPGSSVDIVYGVEENVWNGNTQLQLKVKDITEHI